MFRAGAIVARCVFEATEDAGLDHNLNFPLARGSNDDLFLATLETASTRVRAFGPNTMIIALGLDAYINDLFKRLAITTPGFVSIAAAIAALITLIFKTGSTTAVVSVAVPVSRFIRC